MKPMNLSGIAAEKMDVTGVIYTYICFFNLINEIARKEDMASIEYEGTKFALVFGATLNAVPDARPIFLFNGIENESEGNIYTYVAKQVFEKKRIHRALMEKFEEYTPRGRELEMDFTASVHRNMIGTVMFHVHMEESDQMTAEKLRKDIFLALQNNAEEFGDAREEASVFLTQEEVSVMLDFLLRARIVYDRLRKSIGENFEGCINKSLWSSRRDICYRFMHAVDIVFKKLDDDFRNLSKEESGEAIATEYARVYRFAATYRDGYENLKRCRSGAVLLIFRAVGSGVK
jgi:hypothetical protein